MSRFNPLTNEEDAALLKFPKEFENADTLTIAEVCKILENRKEQSAKAGTEQQLGTVFLQMLEYCTTFNKFGDNKEKIHAVRRILSTKKLHKFELAQLANLCPDEPEEAKIFIPSLAHKFQDEELAEILDTIKSL